MMTANDYLWNPGSYNPEKSLHTAMKKRYGNQLINLLFEFKDIELTLRKMIGECKKLDVQRRELFKKIQNVV